MNLNSTAPRGQRQAGIELLRVLAMVMVVMLHYLLFGGALSKTELLSGNFILAWCLEALCIVAVNCYVLISGYFLCTSTFKLKKIVVIWLQVLFYCLFFTAIFLLAGAPFTFKELLGNLLPVLTSEHWFATTYIGLYFLFPFLNIFIRAMSKRQFEVLLVTLFAIFSLWKSLLPFAATFDPQNGYSIVWFIFLYFVAAYIRLHYRAQRSRWAYLVGYLGLSGLTASSKFLIGAVASGLGRGMSYSTAFYNYNAFTVFFASVGLFLFFKDVKINNARVAQLICTVGSLTFGVYLIHVNSFMRGFVDLTLLHAERFYSSALFLPVALVSVAVTFAACALIELARQKTVGRLEKSAVLDRICTRLSNLKLFRM